MSWLPRIILRLPSSLSPAATRSAPLITSFAPSRIRFAAAIIRLWHSVVVGSTCVGGSPREGRAAKTTRPSIRTDFRRMGSDTGIPLVAAIFPVPAGTLRREAHVEKILHHLVAELDGAVETQRSAVCRRQRLAVHAVCDQGLRVQRALPIPRRVIPAVERAKLHVLRASIGAGALG